MSEANAMARHAGALMGNEGLDPQRYSRQDGSRGKAVGNKRRRGGEGGGRGRGGVGH